ncbi:hypothetical protein JSE7799_03478 [Jannaschia seosinensis]|uniref:Rho termination factor N-terminal domain-containing protein n=1 Tax=Jannaschia seosinensis TaxID=313367 RepID=A0A0M7BFQ7_9RHOB|nr:hypothetical protein [Jannaschia seosinensis]CUH40743.1 hypothetical protein JSE7799_03478 [Jannaschia seosinensis]
MSTKLEDLDVAALKDLARVQAVEGGNDMTRDELLDALDEPVDDVLARWLGKTRQEVYAAAGEAGIEGRQDMQKRDLLEALAKKG